MCLNAVRNLCSAYTHDDFGGGRLTLSVVIVVGCFTLDSNGCCTLHSNYDIEYICRTACDSWYFQCSLFLLV